MLVSLGTASLDVLEFLQRAAKYRITLLIAGPTGAGKTSMVRYLAKSFDPAEHIVTIEETRELHLTNILDHVTELETREADPQGLFGITATDAIRLVLHMHPTRIILAEIRGAEAFDWLAAAGTGHRGSITTIHADAPDQVVDRCVQAMLSARLQATADDLRRYVARAVELVVFIRQMPDGTRRITEVSEIITDIGGYRLNPLWVTATDPDGKHVLHRQGDPSPRLAARLEGRFL